jgi:hypothetical protein
LAAGLLLAVAAGAQDRDPRAEALYQAGLAGKQAKDFSTALEKFRAAIKLDPNYADAYWGAAWCYVALGNDAGAIEAFRWVIRLVPETANGLEAAKAIERIRLRAPGLNATPPEPDTFLIAVALVREANADIWLADAAGNLRRRLTTEPASDTQPAFSGDAHQVVFVSDRSGNRDLWAIKADGTGLRQLTTDPAADYSPTWNPTTNEIVYVSERSGKPELWSLDAASGETHSRGEGNASLDPAPAWAPTGDRLAWVSDRDGTGNIYLWEAATRTSRALLSNKIPQQHPVWSPDGQTVYFTWSLEGNWQVCSVQATGEGLGAVAPTPDNERLWGVSPDGAALLVSSDHSGTPRLYLRPRSGGAAKVVAQGAGEVLSAAVSPALPQSVAEILLSVSPHRP